MDNGTFDTNDNARQGDLVVAVDDGYARTKICVPSLNGADDLWGAVPQIREFGTVITRRMGAAFNEESTAKSSWIADGQQFSVDEYSVGDTVATDHYHWSPMNRVLVNHYLTQCGLSGVDIDLLVVGLPMSQYYSRTGKRSEMVEKKIASLMTPVTPVGLTPQPPRIREVRVVPQGRSALVDHMFGWDLKELGEYMDRTAIIDIGGRTTDLAYILRGETNDPNNSGSLQIGVLNVLAQLNGVLMAHFNRSKEYPPQVLDRALRERRLLVNQVNEDVGEQVDEAVATVAGRLIEEIRSRIVDADIADKILLVGGGASVFGAVLRKAYPNAIVPVDPSWANVRGFWKLGAAMKTTA
jgi:plasmid segregation protein ParM